MIVYRPLRNVRFAIEEDQQILAGEIVYETDPQPTGLLDQNGNELYRVTTRCPPGFDLTCRASRKD